MGFTAETAPDDSWIYDFTGTGPLVYEFPHALKTDIRVEVDGTLLAPDEWTFLGNPVTGGYDGGSVSLVSPTTAADVRIYRETTPVRTTKMGAGGATPEDVEVELTRIVHMVQDAARNMAAAIERIVALEDINFDLAALENALPILTQINADLANPESNLSLAASVSDLIQYVYDEAQIGGSLAHIFDNKDDLARFVGYFPPETYDSMVGQTITDNRTTVTYDAGSGLATYAVQPDSLPYTVPASFVPADWRLLELQPEVTQAEYDALQRRLARLERIHPPELPRWKYTPIIDVAAGFTGTVFDFEPYIVDGDSLFGEISIEAESLPTGFSIDGFVLMADNPPVQAEAAYVLRVIDESGVYEAGPQRNPVGIEVYDTVAPQRAPSWEDLPDLTFIRGNQMLSFNVTTFGNDPDGDDGAIVYTVANLPDGVTFNGTSLVGRPTAAAGDYTITWTATDEDGLQTDASQTLTLVDPGPPVWSDIPYQAVARNASIQTIDYLAYVADDNTPDNELVITVTGNPNGTTLSNGQLSGAPTVDGTFQIDVTATNNAGLARTKRHTITVTTSTTGGGGGGGFETELD